MNLKIMLICTIFLAVITSGCSSLNNINDKVDFAKADIAVIETATFNNISYLKLYNSNGEKVAENPVDCVDINSGFITPVAFKNKVYCNSLGGYSNPSKKTVEFDLLNNKYSTYEINDATLDIAVNDNYIFTTYSPAAGSVITKYNIKTRSVEGTINVPGVVGHMCIVKNLLYAFADSDDRDGSTIISIINTDTLKIEKSIKRSKSGLSVFNSININDFIYFAHSLPSDDTNPIEILSKLNINDGSITDIVLSEARPNQVEEYKNALLITHYNAQEFTGNKLTELNLSTNEQKIITFPHALKQIEIKGNKLYSIDGTDMYIYDLDSNFKLLNKFEIKATKKDYRINAFFLTK